MTGFRVYYRSRRALVRSDVQRVRLHAAQDPAVQLGVGGGVHERVQVDRVQVALDASEASVAISENEKTSEAVVSAALMWRTCVIAAAVRKAPASA